MGNGALDYFQVFIMLISAFLYLRKFSIKRNETSLFLLILCMFISIIYTKVIAITSLVYSIFFIFTFIEYKRCLEKQLITLDSFKLFLKYIIYAYCIVIIIQQISKILGLPILNGLAFYTDEYRFNALSNEPSHTSRILLICMVAYMYIKKISSDHKYTIIESLNSDKKLWIAYMYTLATSGSATAFISIPIAFLFFLNLKNFIIYGSILFLAIIAAINYIEIPFFIRIKELFAVILTFDTEIISYVELSGAARVNPYIYYIQDFDILSLDTWLGKGNGYAGPMLLERVLGHESSMENAEAGGIFPVLFYDYGLLTGLAFIYALLKLCLHKKHLFFIFIWITIFSSTTFNSYMQWLFFCISYTTIYLFKKKQLCIR